VAIVRNSTVLGTLEPLLAQFDNDNNVSQPSGAHQSTSFLKYLNVVVKELQDYQVFKMFQAANTTLFQSQGMYFPLSQKKQSALGLRSI